MTEGNNSENADSTAGQNNFVIAIPVVMVSAAMLMFQILQTITLSLQLFDRNAFLVVSFSMLGLGAGGTLATLLAGRAREDRVRWLWACVNAFAILVLIATIVGSRLDSLVSIVLINLLPYIPVGIMLSFVFFFWPEQTHRNYFFNLLGSGLGCIALIMVLNLTGDAAMTALVISGIALLGTMPLAFRLSGIYLKASVLAFVVVCCLSPTIDDLVAFMPAREKHYGQILSNPAINTRLDWTKWGFLGRLDSVVPVSGIERFALGKPAQKILDRGADYRYLFASGDNWSYTVDFRQNGDFKKEFAANNILAIPYVLTEASEVLNIGLGGGIDVFLALYHGARSVVGVEINPLMIEAVKNRHRSFYDDPFNDARVTIKEMDGRTFVNNTDRKFDVITLSAVDTGAGIAFGGNIMSENYLYTREAFNEFFSALKDRGFFMVFRPTRQLMRSIVTAVETMRAMGIQHPEKHYAVFGDDMWRVALFGRSPLTDADISRIVSLVQSHSGRYDLFYLPVETNGSSARYISQCPEFGSLFESIASGNETRFIAECSHNIAPITDDSPYFYNQTRNFYDSPAFSLLAFILSTVAIIAFVLILLPLHVISKGGTSFNLRSLAGYFFAIGTGFMFIEIGLIQKLVLFLGHPSYSISVTIFSILIFSGLGSMYSERLRESSAKARLAIFAGIITSAVCYAFVPSAWLSVLYSESLLWRCLVAAVLIAPGSFVMGMPFPTMMRSISQSQAGAIPWAYAINSFASVVASVFAIIISMTTGFTSLFLAAAAFYVIAYVLSNNHSLLIEIGSDSLMASQLKFL